MISKSLYLRLATATCALLLTSCTAPKGSGGHSKAQMKSSSAAAKDLSSFVLRAKKLLEDEGEHEAFTQFREKGDKWFTGERYIFVLKEDGTSVVHPAKPELEGRSLLTIRDGAGKEIVNDFIKVVSSDAGQGWVHYEWPKPGSDAPSHKSSYVAKVTAASGGTYIVGSGQYDIFVTQK